MSVEGVHTSEGLHRCSISEVRGRDLARGMSHMKRWSEDPHRELRITARPIPVTYRPLLGLSAFASVRDIPYVGHATCVFFGSSNAPSAFVQHAGNMRPGSEANPTAFTDQVKLSASYGRHAALSSTALSVTPMVPCRIIASAAYSSDQAREHDSPHPLRFTCGILQPPGFLQCCMLKCIHDQRVRRLLARNGSMATIHRLMPRAA